MIKDALEHLQEDYNTQRPHDALNKMTPKEEAYSFCKDIPFFESNSLPQHLI
ncbi:integrase core domain-containing protein [Albibacterium profundi]|uniref:integrase core domain-containing protein n=1 Tax=Albibacterium profundi TaxID=3134906 RepID=UPI0035D025FE